MEQLLLRAAAAQGRPLPWSARNCDGFTAVEEAQRARRRHVVEYLSLLADGQDADDTWLGCVSIGCVEGCACVRACVCVRVRGDGEGE